MYSIEISKSAKNFLKKLQINESEIILKKIYSIKQNPFYHLKKLKGQKFWRLRIMKYRAIVDVIVFGKKIIVLRIGRRKNVY
ncbi:type II toxin-antitoxin system RelE/ParE family toxin [Nanoarchaeota archaeon]